MIYHNKRVSLAGILPEIFALIVGVVTGGLIATVPYVGVTILLAIGSVAVVTLFIAHHMGDGTKSKPLDLMGMTPSAFALVIGLVVGAILGSERITWWIIILLFSVLFGVLALLYALYPIGGQQATTPLVSTDTEETPADTEEAEGDDQE